MKISDIKEKQKNINIDVKVIYDQMSEQERWGRRWKTLVVADIDSKQGDATALLDVCDDDIKKFKQFDKIKVVNCMAKIIETNRGVQPLITYGFINKQLVGHYEKIEDESKQCD